jgi:AhpD family alkylhydroperoxidase
MSQPSTSYPHLAHEVRTQVAALRAGQPALMDGFQRMAGAATEAGTLSVKTKELMALALGVAAHCDACIAFHAKALAGLRATRAEIEETLAVAVYMGGGPSLMYSANALTAFEQFEVKAAG